MVVSGAPAFALVAIVLIVLAGCPCYKNQGANYPKEPEINESKPEAENLNEDETKDKYLDVPQNEKTISDFERSTNSAQSSKSTKSIKSPKGTASLSNAASAKTLQSGGEGSENVRNEETFETEENNDVGKNRSGDLQNAGSNSQKAGDVNVAAGAVAVPGT